MPKRSARDAACHERNIRQQLSVCLISVVFVLNIFQYLLHRLSILKWMTVRTSTPAAVRCLIKFPCCKSRFFYLRNVNRRSNARVKGILADKPREKDDDNCAYKRHQKSGGMKFRTLLWSGEQSRNQPANDGSGDAQQCGSNKSQVSVHDRTSNQPYNKPDDNRPNNV